MLFYSRLSPKTELLAKNPILILFIFVTTKFQTSKMIQKEKFMPHSLGTMASGNIIELISVYKMGGYGIYWMIMEHLFRQQEYKSSLKVMMILSKQWGVSASKMEKILCNFGLFFIENGFVYSSELSENEVSLDENAVNLNENSSNFDENSSKFNEKPT